MKTLKPLLLLVTLAFLILFGNAHASTITHASLSTPQLKQAENISLNYAPAPISIDANSNDWPSNTIQDLAFEFTYTTITASFGVLVGFNQTFFLVEIHDDTEVLQANLTANGIDAITIWLDLDASQSLSQGDEKLLIYRNGTTITGTFLTQWTFTTLTTNEFNIQSSDQSWIAEGMIPQVLPENMYLGVDYQDAISPDTYEIDAAFDSQVRVSITETLDFTLCAQASLPSVSGSFGITRNLPVLQTLVGYTLNITLIATSQVNAPVNASCTFLLPAQTTYLIPANLQNILFATSLSNGSTLLSWNIGVFYSSQTREISFAITFNQEGNYTFSKISVTWQDPQGAITHETQGNQETIHVLSNLQPTTETTTTINTEISNFYSLPAQTSTSSQVNTFGTEDLAKYLGLVFGISIPLALGIALIQRIKKS